jgi:integrase
VPIENADKRRDVYLTLDERRRLVAACDGDLALFLRGLSMLPLRPGALAALTVKHYDPRLQVLTVGKDKAGQDRKVALPAPLAALLEECTRGKTPAAPLFTRDGAKAWNKDAWKKPIKAATKAAGLNEGTVAYALRHSAITDLIKSQRVDLLTVAQLAGTSVAMIERHYGHLLREHATQALATLAL